MVGATPVHAMTAGGSARQIGTSDADARHTIRTALNESLIVEASAGAGKTTELVNRIVAVLRAGLTTIDCIAAVTFTHKAAGELKVLLRQALDVARTDAHGDERDRLEHAIKRLEEAAIGTIHGFCAQILRERPVEARVDPGFKELNEREQSRLYARAFRSWFESALNEDRPGLRRALSRLAWSHDGLAAPPSERLAAEGRKLVEWRDFRAPWKREPFDRTAEMRELAKAVIKVARMSRHGGEKDVLYAALRPVRDVEEWIERQKLRPTPALDDLEALLLKLLADLKKDTRKGRGMFSAEFTRETLVSERDVLMTRLQEFKRRADADFAAELQADMAGLIESYEALKQRSGKLDFVDLLVKTRDLLTGDPAVRRHLQTRFTHLFIDEFQDTDPVQAEILLLLAASDPAEQDWRNASPDPGKLFIVGDPKQSIYKFRRADVLLYQEIRDHLTARGVGLVKMSVSHRASQPIQRMVNAAFAPEMEESREHGQAGYTPLEGTLEGIPGQPALIALPAPRPWGKTRITNTAIDMCLPDAVAAFIEWLVRESEWRVRAPGERRLVPIEERHIAVLFRRFVNFGEDLTRGYVRSLEARGIGHLLVGSKSFHQREEIGTLRAACTSIEWPGDELSVYAALKGSLFAIPDNLLLRYRQEVGHLHPLRPESEGLAEAFGAFGAIKAALDVLASLHRARNERPAADTLNLLLEAARAHAGFALRPGGHQVVSNLYRLIEMARSFETGGGISFRGFVEELAERADKAENAEAPMIEESANGVRLMTVHSAKGLEFPIVILADLTAKLASATPDRFLDPERRLCAQRLMMCAPAELAESETSEHARELAEGTRVAYVAATRARDLLVVTAVGDEPRTGWLSPLNKAIYPALGEYRKGRSAPGCPLMGDRTVVGGSDSREGSESVRPGLHTPKHGEHEVVWWDPAALQLNVSAKLGLTGFEILQGNSTVSAEAYNDWRTARAASIERGSAPQWEVANPTDMPDAPPGGWVEMIQLAHGERPFGPRFGTLVHMIMRDAALRPDDLERAARLHGRTSGADDDEIAAAIAAARSAADHPLIARARAAQRCLREAPVCLRIAADRTMEGSIDLAFEENGTWHVVDYKTDSPTGARLAKYERQVKWYGAALARITGKPVRCHMLSV